MSEITAVWIEEGSGIDSAAWTVVDSADWTGRYRGVPLREVEDLRTATVTPLTSSDTLTLETIQRAVEQMREVSAIRQRDMQEQQAALRYQAELGGINPDLNRGWVGLDWGAPLDSQCSCDACQARRMQRREREAGPPDPFKKSLALLREWLSPSQLAQYDREKFFDVTGSAGKRYRIEYGNIANVKEYDETGKIVAHLCFQPAGAAGIYAGDTMLAQKIMLENDEPAALKVANRSPAGAMSEAMQDYRQLGALL